MEAVVRQLSPGDSAAATITPRLADQPASGLGAGVAVVRDWPQRTALLVGHTTRPQILAVSAHLRHQRDGRDAGLGRAGWHRPDLSRS